MRKSFKYKIIPLGNAEEKAFKTLDLCRFLYNCALEERILAYRDSKSLSYYDQQNELPDLKEAFPEYKEVGAHVLQNVLKRLDTVYQNFFRRVKTGKGKAGFPRFKGRNWFRSFTFPDNSGWKVKKNRLVLSKVGEFKIRLHRPIEGTIKTVTIAYRSTGEWFVIFSCDGIESKPLSKTGKSVGIDLGISSFAVDSDGAIMDAPKFFRAQEKYLRRCQRALARKKKGGKNRERARIRVAKAHQKVVNQRHDFFYKMANHYVRNYDEIFVEDLRIKNMIKNKRLSKSLADAAMGNFLNILGGKAANAGRIFQRENPRRTSMTCSDCGNVQKMPLHKRVYKCSKCGVEKCRDYNAAINIKRAGQARLELSTCL